MSAIVLFVRTPAWFQELHNSCLSQPPFELRSVESVIEAVALARSDPPAVAVLVVQEDGTRAAERCRELRNGGDFPIIAAAGKHRPGLAIRVLEAGADDFVSLSITPRELLARVRAHLRRALQHDTEQQAVVNFVGFEMNRDRREIHTDKTDICLSPKEFALLEYMVANSRRVVKREELLREVWGLPPGIKSRTLDVHVSRLRQKLAQGRAPVDIATIARVGYRLSLLR